MTSGPAGGANTHDEPAAGDQQPAPAAGDQQPAPAAKTGAGATFPFAEVAVATPLRRSRPGAIRGVPPRLATFHYEVPAELREHIAPGALVWVPFGRRRHMGVVLALYTRSPVDSTRPILSVVSTPLSVDLVLLARWMSAYYLAPLFECVSAMLPPGALAHEVEVFKRTKAPIHVAHHTPTALRVLGAFAGGKQLTPAEVGRAAKVTHPEDALAPLAAAGLIVRELRQVGQAVGHREVAYVHLDGGASERAWSVLRTTKGTARADVVAHLASDPEPMAVPDVLAAVGCTKAVVNGLARSGVVDIAPGVTTLHLALPADAAAEALAKQLAGAPAQADVLRCILTAGGAITRDQALAQTQRSPAAIKGLADRGLIQVVALPDMVRLRDPADALRTEARLRGIEEHLRVIAHLEEVADPLAQADVRAALNVSSSVLADLVAMGLVQRAVNVEWRDPLATPRRTGRPPPVLSSDQEQAWRAIRAAVMLAAPDTGAADPDAPGRGRRVPVGALPDRRAPGAATAGGVTSPPVVLLHGVTGSGKTELYLRAVQATLDAGRSAIVMVPEIALAPQTVQRVAARFGNLVGVWHSELTPGERHDTWERVRLDHVRVLVGSRSAVFAPMRDLGLIVLDEEHSSSYKQIATPRYHAREVAIVRARHTGAAVILGSATPALETTWHAQRGRYHRVALPRRLVAHGRDAAGPTFGDLPPVKVVDMRAELRAGNTSIFSRLLFDAVSDALAHRRQVILFLNRRGSSTFVLCRDCGTVVECPRCRLPLTYHGAGLRLTCHHCGHREHPPMMCRQCGSHRVRYFGAGTQRVAHDAQHAFPDARVLRWDVDTTRGRGRHDQLLATFADGEADILVGTQMIAKGLDLPAVTVVGVVSADTALGLPDFRSAERTFELLTQVAGRAGRSAWGGRVIVQTYKPLDPAIRFAAEHDYEGFYEHEIAFRGEQLYPPFSHLVRMEFQAPSEAAARMATEKMAFMLVERVRQLGLPDTAIIGPAPCYFAKVRNSFRWQVVVRSVQPHALLGDMDFPPGWRIDVDPTSLL